MGKKEDSNNMHAAWFVAATLVAVACLQRASVVSLVEHWRLWGFLALNLLLLAILFTSTSVNPLDEASHQESNNDKGQHKSNKREKGTKQCRRRMTLADEDSGGDRSRGNEEREQVVENAKESHQLSKEELNERVEAFIAMFRQQLVSDAKNRSKLVSDA